MGGDRNRQLVLGLVLDGELVLQTGLAQHEQELCGKRQREVLEERVVLIIYIAGAHPCAIFVGALRNNGMHTLVQEAVNVVVERCSLVHRQVILRIRGAQNAVGKPVGQVQRRQTPDFRRCPNVVGGIRLIPAEKFNAVYIIVQAQHVGADARRNQCGISAGGELYAFQALPIYRFCLIFHLHQCYIISLRSAIFRNFNRLQCSHYIIFCLFCPVL